MTKEALSSVELNSVLRLPEGGLIEFAAAGREADWAEALRCFVSGGLAGAEAVPSSGSAEVMRAALPFLGEQACFFKLFYQRGPLDRLKHAIGIVRALRAACASFALSDAGFAVPEVYCAAVFKKRGMARRSILVAAEIPKAETAAALLSAAGLSPGRRRALAVQLASEVAKLHAAGFYHGDMQAKNILCKEEHLGRFRFYWLDNERTKRYRSLPLTRRMRNLRQLAHVQAVISGAERRRFWRSYTAAAGLSAKERRRLLLLASAERLPQRRFGPLKLPDRLSLQCAFDEAGAALSLARRRG